MGARTPARMRRSVDLPAPLGPRRTMDSPREARKVTSARAVRRAKRRERANASMRVSESMTRGIVREQGWDGKCGIRGAVDKNGRAHGNDEKKMGKIGD